MAAGCTLELEESAGQLGVLQVDPPGVAPVAGGAGLEVEVEGGGAGDQGVLRCLHREHVQDLVTEPDIHIGTGAAAAPHTNCLHLVQDFSGLRPFSLATGTKR